MILIKPLIDMIYEYDLKLLDLILAQVGHLQNKIGLKSAHWLA